MPIDQCKPVKSAQYQHLAFTRTGLCTIAVEIRKEFAAREPLAFACFGKIAEERAPENGKGCDFGYAPAIRSCERANSVDTCTVAALDAIAAFAVPNPSSSSQSQPVFSGLVARSGRPAEQITQPTSGWQI